MRDPICTSLPKFCVQRGEGDAEDFGGFALGLGAGPELLYLFQDLAALEFRDAARKRNCRGVVAQVARQCRGQTGARDVTVHRHDRGIIDSVAQLPDIARPVVLQKQLARVRIHHVLALVLYARHLQEMLCQREYVIAPFAQRRDRDRHAGNAVIQVASEFLFLDILHQTDVARADKAHVSLDLFVAADSAQLAFLKHAQELGLQLVVHFGYFVQEQCTAPCGLKEAGLSAFAGAGEGSALVAEEFAFQQALADGGAVYRNEGPELALALVMYGLSKELLAGSAFAVQKQRAVIARYLLCQVLCQKQGFAFAYDVIECVLGAVGLVESVAQHGGVTLQLFEFILDVGCIGEQGNNGNGADCLALFLDRVDVGEILDVVFFAQQGAHLFAGRKDFGCRCAGAYLDQRAALDLVQSVPDEFTVTRVEILDAHIAVAYEYPLFNCFVYTVIVHWI